MKSWILSGVLAGAILGATGQMAARAETLVSGDFSSDPKGGSRFVFNGDGTLTAQVNTELATEKLLFGLGSGRTLTELDTFKVTARLKITNLVADPNGFAQISLGLVNSGTTGNDRSGGASGGSSMGDAFDVVTFDYFANVTPFGGPALQNSIITSNTGSDSVFSNIVASFGTEIGLDNTGESPLPTEEFLTVQYVYDAATRTTTLKVLNEGGAALAINMVGKSNLVGGLDGDVTTIQTVLPGGRGFTVDAFAIPLWTDSWGAFDFNLGTFSPQSLAADVIFDSFAVESIPEPATVSVLGLAVVALIARRRSQQR